MRAPAHAALTRGDIGWPPLSPSVAAPSCANAAARASVIARSSRLTFASLAEGEGFEPSRGLVAPYSLSRRAPSATRSALRHPSIRAVRRGPDGYGRGVNPVEALERTAELLMRGRAPSYRQQAFRKSAPEVPLVPDA